MNVTIVLGSIRIERQSHKVALYLDELLQQQRITVQLIDLADTPLPLFGDRSVNQTQVQVHSDRIRNLLQQADALLLVTPEYHGSFSGVLKNTLDYFWAEFHKKPIGVVAVSAGRFGGVNASSQLQHVVLSLGAFALPVKLLIPEVHRSFNESFEPVQDELRQSVQTFLTEFLWLADAVYQKKAQTSLDQAVPEK